MNKKIIGRVDKIDFPKLGLYNIDVKIDTGAYTSAIHCSDIIIENNQIHHNGRDDNYAGINLIGISGLTNIFVKRIIPIRETGYTVAYAAAA